MECSTVFCQLGYKNTNYTLWCKLKFISLQSFYFSFCAWLMDVFIPPKKIIHIGKFYDTSGFCLEVKSMFCKVFSVFSFLFSASWLLHFYPLRHTHTLFVWLWTVAVHFISFHLIEHARLDWLQQLSECPRNPTRFVSVSAKCIKCIETQHSDSHCAPAFHEKCYLKHFVCFSL